jgi:FKBP-type peptidyl-prolyl cis-trans isomerase (trigger factor)
MLEEQKARIKQQGLEWEQFLTHIKKSQDDFMKDHRKGAEERIIARLGVQYIIKDAKVSASDEETEAKIKEIASKYPDDQKQKIADYYKNDKEAFK